ncbi:uncharacterized protein LOC131215455 [Anopheles bellator]|uniref:uncharacterized protein LOC131215455 n=1 Tax=Anopheles bellator TaxID=139047 RepID=UPI002648035B|nr:uncharacterized protein LOC131215455 [Anopheles bellator]
MNSSKRLITTTLTRSELRKRHSRHQPVCQYAQRIQWPVRIEIFRTSCVFWLYLQLASSPFYGVFANCSDSTPDRQFNTEWNLLMELSAAEHSLAVDDTDQRDFPAHGEYQRKSTSMETPFLSARIDSFLVCL